MTTIEQFAEEFAEEPGYLNFARLGPLGRSVIEEEQMQLEFLRHARFGSLDQSLDQDGRLREVVGTLTGFRPDQVAFQPNTSTGLMQTMFGLAGTVALSPHEFPSLRYAVTRAQQAMGQLAPLWLETEYERVTPGTVREQLTPEVTAVAVSLVDFRTGYVADLEGIRQVIGDRLLIVDAVQGFGVVDAPWQVADVIASGGHKWLRSGLGTGFLALSDRAAEQLVPVLSGWLPDLDLPMEGVADAPRGAAAFRLAAANPVAQSRLAASLELVQQTGVAEISRSVAGKIDRLLELADEFAIPVVSPRAESERAGIMVLRPAEDQLTVMAASLFNHGITATQREGMVRLSAHVSTSDETFDLVRSALLDFSTATSL